MFTVLFSSVFGAALNRFSGFANVSFLPGRNVYYSLLVLAIVAGVTLDPISAILIFVSAALYRIPGWYASIDMGTKNGSLEQDAVIMYLRTLCLFPYFVYAFIWQGEGPALFVLCVAAVLSVAAYIAGNHILAKFVKDPFIAIEASVGAIIGGAFGIVINGVAGG